MADANDIYVWQKVALHCPSLEEVARVLEDGLHKNFTDASVSVVECPDLTQKPFMLAAEGLCGSPRVADVGGVPNLMPSPKREKRYNLERVSTETELPGALIVGAGAGPFYHEGVNCELIANIKTGTDGTACNNNTHIAKINKEDNTHILKKSETADFAYMGNLFISQGQPGKILEVKAGRRTGKQNFMLCLRQTLKAHYGEQPVALGGTFLVEKGKAKLHIMPDFSPCPLNTDEKVDNWLRFFEMPAPLTCLGYLVSHDPNLDLRIEHFHCFSDHGDGGHYHYDTTPDEVMYRGYLNVAEYMYRIDRPKETHQVGRD